MSVIIVDADVFCDSVKVDLEGEGLWLAHIEDGQAVVSGPALRAVLGEWARQHTRSVPMGDARDGGSPAAAVRTSHFRR